MAVKRLAPKGEDLEGVPHRLKKGTSASEDAGPRRVWIVMSHIGWGGEQNTLYKGVTAFKSLERKPERESPKRTISVSRGFWSLQSM